MLRVVFIWSYAECLKVNKGAEGIQNKVILRNSVIPLPLGVWTLEKYFLLFSLRTNLWGILPSLRSKQHKMFPSITVAECLLVFSDTSYSLLHVVKPANVPKKASRAAGSGPKGKQTVINCGKDKKKELEVPPCWIKFSYT